MDDDHHIYPDAGISPVGDIWHCALYHGLGRATAIAAGDVQIRSHIYPHKQYFPVHCADKTGPYSIKGPAKLTTATLWFMSAVFLLITIGNLFSQNKWEQLIFTPLTLLLSVAAFVLARKRD
ncbi:hypothetical protein [uncultured Chitinophaga sp.]|uniref:hypothetical protein n=1 Tax=uncultured Chitinophaga sp. TaxID=339340 RepID=UPI0025EAD2A8|nr:hypothetical protein [uncultured Chitinophaga sp.]